MALQALQPPIPYRPRLPSPPSSRAVLHLPPPRRPDPLDGPPLIAAARGRHGVRIGAAKRGLEGSGLVRKEVDLATLGNLCVDIVLNVPSLPPSPIDQRRAYMERLSSSPPDKKHWEAGGNCNLAIAAARLGLQCVTLGHVGDEIYGHFLLDVLQDEGIGLVRMNGNTEAAISSTSYETLLCWVLVDPFQRHGFCSRADFSADPAFSWMTRLTGVVTRAIQQCKILFCNGYTFDDLYPDVIISALHCAIDSGTAIFFDPGPRGRKLLHGTPEQQGALEQFLRLSDVLLLTSDEAESLTGNSNPILAGQELIKKGVRTRWVIIKMSSKGSLLITNSSVSCAPAFKVSVVDTVGCGDSFTAAIAFGFLHELAAVNTITLANAVGAATATGCGAGRNVAELDKVLEILGQSNLNKDDDFWNQLLVEENPEKPEITLVCNTSINGYSDRLVHVPIRTIVSELIPKFKALRESTVQQA